jgi:UPF0755 protein
MLRKILLILTLIIVVAGLWSLWHEYKSYRQRQQERIARLQEQAEEVQVTTIEGWTIKDISKALADKKLFSEDTFTNALKAFDASSYLLVAQSKPKTASLEGFLFPDTYRFNAKTEPVVVISKMLADFTTRVKKLGVTEDKSSYTIAGYESYSMNFYKVLTLASIIEKESGGKGPMSLEEERATIASVFYNRLVMGQALQSDPTVNYATGKSSLATSDSDRAFNSPYNTYLYPGLPPGPICNPSISSINAALHPKKTDYYYFFHKTSGEVVFSKTFAEHQRQLAQ